LPKPKAGSRDKRGTAYGRELSLFICTRKILLSCRGQRQWQTQWAMHPSVKRRHIGHVQACICLGVQPHHTTAGCANPLALTCELTQPWRGRGRPKKHQHPRQKQALHVFKRSESVHIRNYLTVRVKQKHSFFIIFVDYFVLLEFFYFLHRIDELPKTMKLMETIYIHQNRNLPVLDQKYSSTTRFPQGLNHVQTLWYRRQQPI
jgi:hypothetical protein